MIPVRAKRAELKLNVTVIKKISWHSSLMMMMKKKKTHRTRGLANDDVLVCNIADSIKCNTKALRLCETSEASGFQPDRQLINVLNSSCASEAQDGEDVGNSRCGIGRREK